MKLKKNQLVCVTWEDHCSYEGKWVTNPEYHQICTVDTVGYVAIDGKNYLTIAMNKQINDETYSCLMTLVKSCITKIRKLK